MRAIRTRGVLVALALAGASLAGCVAYGDVGVATYEGDYGYDGYPAARVQELESREARLARRLEALIAQKRIEGPPARQAA